MNDLQYKRVASTENNILTLDCGIFRKICREVDSVPGLLDKLIATQDGTYYALSVLEANECRQSTRCGPCDSVLHLWGTRGMKISQLIQILDMLHLEKELMLLVNPIPLRLVKDIPTELTVVQGNTLKLECMARGFPYPQYCWFRNQTLLCKGSGELVITNIGLNDTGRYICRIHNILKNPKEILWTSSCKVYVKETMLIHVIPPKRQTADIPESIHFKKQPPKKIKVKYQERFEIGLEAIGPYPLHYQWCKDGEVLDGSPDSPVLRITSATHKNSGVYQCTVYNNDKHFESKSHECIVEIVYPEPFYHDQPVIIKQPADRVVNMHDEVTFEVNVNCVNEVRYQWFHNGVSMEGCNSERLTVKVVRRSQEGEYQCYISTQPAEQSVTILSRAAKLTINATKICPGYYATDKLAILIGHSNYRSNNRVLPAAKNDLYVAHEVFSSLGYKTLSCLDYSLEEMNTWIDLAIDMMRGKKNDKLYVVLYVVGHGFIHQGVTYLVPSTATEGAQISQCLAIERIEKDIVRELKPITFLLITDICQIEQDNVIGEGVSTKGPVSKGMIIFRAASKGEEALEKKNPSKVTQTGGWIDITSQKELRGIFSASLFSVLERHENVVFHNLFRLFNDVFDRSMFQYKEQNPVFEINLNEERGLLDPINPYGQEDEYEERLRKYNSLIEMGSDFQILLCDGWRICGRWKARASNILELILYEEDKRPAHHRHDKVEFMIVTQNLPVQTKPHEMYRYEDDLKCGIKQKRGYIFYNLQQLQTPLECHLMITFNETSFNVLIGAKYPLISFMMLHPKKNMHSLPNNHREACEHVDSADIC